MGSVLEAILPIKNITPSEGRFLVIPISDKQTKSVRVIGSPTVRVAPGAIRNVTLFIDTSESGRYISGSRAGPLESRLDQRVSIMIYIAGALTAESACSSAFLI